MKSGKFKASELRKVAPAPCSGGGLRIGDVVTLNSGGPRMLVVDLNGDRVTVSWKDAAGCAVEREMPRVCVSKVQ